MRWVQLMLFFAGVLSSSPAWARLVTPADIPAALRFFSCAGGNEAKYYTVGCSSLNSVVVAEYAPASVFVSATYPGDLAFVESSASGTIIYSFAVIGGVDGTIVPVKFAISLSGDAGGNTTGNSYYFAAVTIKTDQGSFSRNVCSSGCGVGTGAEDYFGFNQIDAIAGSINTVQLTAVAFNTLSINSLSATAFADPYIFVDPLFEDAADYSIIVSQGVGNFAPGGVPEPATWAMMILGFGAVGSAMRRRKSLVT